MSSDCAQFTTSPTHGVIMDRLRRRIDVLQQQHKACSQRELQSQLYRQDREREETSRLLLAIKNDQNTMRRTKENIGGKAAKQKADYIRTKTIDPMIDMRTPDGINTSLKRKYPSNVTPTNVGMTMQSSHYNNFDTSAPSNCTYSQANTFDLVEITGEERNKKMKFGHSSGLHADVNSFEAAGNSQFRVGQTNNILRSSSNSDVNNLSSTIQSHFATTAMPNSIVTSVQPQLSHDINQQEHIDIDSFLNDIIDEDKSTADALVISSTSNLDVSQTTPTQARRGNLSIDSSSTVVRNANQELFDRSNSTISHNGGYQQHSPYDAPARQLSIPNGQTSNGANLTNQPLQSLSTLDTNYGSPVDQHSSVMNQQQQITRIRTPRSVDRVHHTSTGSYPHSPGVAAGSVLSPTSGLTAHGKTATLSRTASHVQNVSAMANESVNFHPGSQQLMTPVVQPKVSTYASTCQMPTSTGFSARQEATPLSMKGLAGTYQVQPRQMERSSYVSGEYSYISEGTNNSAIQNQHGEQINIRSLQSKPVPNLSLTSTVPQYISHVGNFNAANAAAQQVLAASQRQYGGKPPDRMQYFTQQQGGMQDTQQNLTNSATIYRSGIQESPQNRLVHLPNHPQLTNSQLFNVSDLGLQSNGTVHRQGTNVSYMPGDNNFSQYNSSLQANRMALIQRQRLQRAHQLQAANTGGRSVMHHNQESSQLASSFYNPQMVNSMSKQSSMALPTGRPTAQGDFLNESASVRTVHPDANSSPSWNEWPPMDNQSIGNLNIAPASNPVGNQMPLPNTPHSNSLYSRNAQAMTRQRIVGSNSTMQQTAAIFNRTDNGFRSSQDPRSQMLTPFQQERLIHSNVPVQNFQHTPSGNAMVQPGTMVNGYASYNVSSAEMYRS